MAPFYATLQTRALDAASSHLAKRDLTVNHTQAVTLGVMGAYVVVIALLWNLPYVRWSLWPFKVGKSYSLCRMDCLKADY
jgi:hypothetical protein